MSAGTQLHGYHGQYLWIDVTTGAWQFRRLPAEVLRNVLGGTGLAVHLLLKDRQSQVDPFDSAAAIVFSFSPLVGSPLTTSAKFSVVSRSPLTGRLNDSLASSGFAIAGKKVGADAIYITGRCSELSVLVIDDSGVRLEAAESLRGKTNSETQSALKQQFGAEYQFATIGPAGEMGVRFATISHDGRHAGRGGSGAVLGSRNLKAIAVQGSHRCTWAHPEQLIEYARDLSRRSFGPATAKYRELGTASNLLTFNRLNVLPTRNFQQGHFEGAEAVSPEAINMVREKTRASCAACTIGCEHLYSIQRPESQETVQVRLEYENLFALGPLCGIDDSGTILEASHLCDEYGIDTISAGGTIAFAMECAERGFLDHPWLRFGSKEAILNAIHRIIQPNDALGRMLAGGSRRMAQEIGHDTIRFAPQVKGLEIPGYDPRGLQMMALGFAVGTRGADHNRSGAYEIDFSEAVDRRNASVESITMAIETEDKAAIMDSLILCKFLRRVFDNFFAESAAMLKLVTGWNMTESEIRSAAVRIITMKKQFNIQSGWTPEEDTLPDRILRQPLPEDPESRLSSEKLQQLITAYNLARGWDADGWVPGDQTGIDAAEPS
ncbi:MAG: aldehyde ferredoxin oxidoreductase family protein [Planctomyces sp.]|nr:aldehyde ferredoxin oxidoreductase family protein [Planctomyces sp.]